MSIWSIIVIIYLAANAAYGATKSAIDGEVATAFTTIIFTAIVALVLWKAGTFG